MLKSKLFLFSLLCLLLAASIPALAMKAASSLEPVAGEQLQARVVHPELMTRPDRDFPDDWWGLRYMYSEDGGRNWSGIMSAGDAGMWTVNVLGDTIPTWDPSAYNYGAVVDPNNKLNYVVILNSFSDVAELNPFTRVNGLYHVSVDVDGNAAYHLIAAESDDHPMFYSDAGMKRNGQLYCIWASYNLDEGGDPASWAIRASKSTDAGVTWSEPFLVVDNIGYSAGNNFCHMTYEVGHYFFVIYQLPGEAGQAHSIAKVSESLSGDVTIYATGHESSHPYYSYKFGPCNPIAMDADTIYYVLSNETSTGINVGYSLDAGANWQSSPIPVLKRYPSLGLHDMVPYFFTNYGLVAGAYHKNCYFYDEIGYGGGSWVGPIDCDSIYYDGTRSGLYINQSVWTPTGTWMRGCSIWGGAPIEGAMVSVWDGEAWSPASPIWTIFDEEPLNASSIADPTYLAGNDDFVWAAFTGLYGVTDLFPPSVRMVSVSSYMLGEPRVVTVEMTDDSGINYADVNTGLNYAKKGEGFTWAVAEQDSMDTDLLGSGTYFFHLPDSVDGPEGKVALVAGDSVEFYFDALDNNANYGAEHNGDWYDLWIVNQSVQSVGEAAPLPTRLELGGNYPNPFNSLTSIPFSLNKALDIKIAIYDLSGRLVDTVYEGYVTAGSHFVNWRADGVATGIYFYTLEAAGQRQVAKMSLLR
jgi:hypothetical protein